VSVIQGFGLSISLTNRVGTWAGLGPVAWEPIALLGSRGVVPRGVGPGAGAEMGLVRDCTWPGPSLVNCWPYRVWTSRSFYAAAYTPMLMRYSLRDKDLSISKI